VPLSPMIKTPMAKQKADYFSQQLHASICLIARVTSSVLFCDRTQSSTPHTHVLPFEIL